MPLTKIQFQPGIIKESTQYSDGNSWWDSDKVRFKKGKPQKIGGWIQYATSVTFNGETTNNLRGVPRSLHDWGTTEGSNLLGIGTNTKYYVEEGGDAYDITPIRSTTGVGDVTFDATGDVGGSTIKVIDTAHGAEKGDYVTFSGAASLGGTITAAVLNHEYEIAAILNSNEYEIEARDATNQLVIIDVADTGNGGALTVGAYQINTGLNAYSPSTGYGVGAFGSGPWGGGGTLGFSSSLRLWSQSEYGDDLIINPRGGGIYFWDESSGFSTRAVDINSLAGATECPTISRQVMVSTINRHVIAFGVNPIGSATLDPLFVRWSDTESVVNWQPRATNSAGGQLLSTGTQIIGAIKTRQEIIIFTDTSIHSMRFVGGNAVFSFAPVGENISMVSPSAAISAGDAVYFMDKEGFYVYQGSIRKIPCSVLDFVFHGGTLSDGSKVEGYNTSQGFKVISFNDPDHNEVTWFYPVGSAGSVTDNSRYVTYNYQEQVWTVGSMARGAWIHASTKANPVASSNDTVNVNQNILYSQEFGHDDMGSAMNAYIESGEVSINDGDKFMFVKRVIPDFRYVTSQPAGFANLQFDLKRSDFSQISPTSKVTFTVTDQTPQSSVRFRGREMALKITDNGLNYGWTMGTQRFDLRTDGKRGGAAYK